MTIHDNVRVLYTPIAHFAAICDTNSTNEPRNFVKIQLQSHPKKKNIIF